MSRKLISSGSSFEADIGYSRAVVDGDWVFVSGTTGYDYNTMTISASVVEQCEQCLVNIAKALDDSGSSIADVVRVHYILPDATEFKACWPVLQKYFGNVRPAATMFNSYHLNGRYRARSFHTYNTLMVTNISSRKGTTPRDTSVSGAFATDWITYRFSPTGGVMSAHSTKITI